LVQHATMALYPGGTQQYIIAQTILFYETQNTIIRWKCKYK